MFAKKILGGLCACFLLEGRAVGGFLEGASDEQAIQANRVWQEKALEEEESSNLFLPPQGATSEDFAAQQISPDLYDWGHPWMQEWVLRFPQWDLCSQWNAVHFFYSLGRTDFLNTFASLVYKLNDAHKVKTEGAGSLLIQKTPTEELVLSFSFWWGEENQKMRYPCQSLWGRINYAETLDQFYSVLRHCKDQDPNFFDAIYFFPMTLAFPDGTFKRHLFSDKKRYQLELQWPKKGKKVMFHVRKNRVDEVRVARKRALKKKAKN